MTMHYAPRMSCRLYKENEGIYICPPAQIVQKRVQLSSCREGWLMEGLEELSFPSVQMATAYRPFCHFPLSPFSQCHVFNPHQTPALNNSTRLFESSKKWKRELGWHVVERSKGQEVGREDPFAKSSSRMFTFLKKWNDSQEWTGALKRREVAFDPTFQAARVPNSWAQYCSA